MLERRRHTSACRFGLRTSAAKSGDERVTIYKTCQSLQGRGTKWENRDNCLKGNCLRTMPLKSKLDIAICVLPLLILDIYQFMFK